MNSNRKTATILEDGKINVKIKLSALWVALTFLFIYVDYFGLFKPGFIENVIAGEVAGRQVSQVFLLAGMALMTIPSLMIFLSLTLKAKANRWTNVIVGIFEVFILIVFVIGESWAFYIFGTIVEVVLLSLIVWYAWTWPKHERAEVTP
ncbi:hypothetical protein ES703_94663 [subsurface metagenome]